LEGSSRQEEGISTGRRNLNRKKESQSFFLEPSGEILLDLGRQSADELLDELFATLVAETPEPKIIRAKQEADRLIRQLGIWDRTERDYRVDVNLTNAVDEVVFDFMYRNGKVNLMRAVSLNPEPELSWAQTHAAAWQFEVAKDVVAGGHNEMIALVAHRQPDPALGKQLGVLRTLNDKDSAARELGGLLGIGSVPG
jgi:hypothetical protein